MKLSSLIFMYSENRLYSAPLAALRAYLIYNRHVVVSVDEFGMVKERVKESGKSSAIRLGRWLRKRRHFCVEQRDIGNYTNDTIEQSKIRYAALDRNEKNRIDLEIGKFSTWAARYLQSFQDAEIKVHYGDEILDVYRDGPHSCMAHSEYVNFYAINPEKIGIASVNIDGAVAGRALIWKTEEGVTVMDRVYPSDKQSVAYRRLRRYASDAGMVFRDSVSYPDIGSTMYGEDFSVKGLRMHEEMYLPYLDSFYVCSLQPDLSINLYTSPGYASGCGERRYDYATDENGGPYSESGIDCVECGEHFPEEDLCYSEYMGAYLCGSCSVFAGDDYYPAHMCLWSSYYDEYILEEDAVYAEDADGREQLVVAEDAMECHYSGVYIIESQAEEDIDGNPYSASRAARGEFIPKLEEEEENEAA